MDYKKLYFHLMGSVANIVDSIDVMGDPQGAGEIGIPRPFTRPFGYFSGEGKVPRGLGAEPPPGSTRSAGPGRPRRIPARRQANQFCIGRARRRSRYKTGSPKFGEEKAKPLYRCRGLAYNSCERND